MHRAWIREARTAVLSSITVRTLSINFLLAATHGEVLVGGEARAALVDNHSGGRHGEGAAEGLR